VLSFTEAIGGLINQINKLCAADNPILRCIGLHDKCVAGGTGQRAVYSPLAFKHLFLYSAIVQYKSVSSVCSQVSDSLLHVCICCRSVADRMY